MLKNSLQIYFNNLAVFIHVGPFFNIMHEGVKLIQITFIQKHFKDGTGTKAVIKAVTNM